MKYFLIFIISLSALAQTNNQQLINWFAGADIVATSGNSKADLESSFYVREFEISANSSIDQTYEGILTLAYHHELEEGEDHLEVHEAFLFSSKLFNLANVKIGKFFLGFGRLNRFHRHDWVITDAPYVQKSFFGNEGAKDTGIEYKRNLPSLFSTITLGLTSGNEFNHTAEDHDHNEGEVHHANGPTVYARFAKFWEHSTTSGTELGFNFINRKDEESTSLQYVGVDFIYKDRFAKMIKNLVQFEAWMRKSEMSDGDENSDLGAYLYYEKGIDQHHTYGFRVDYFKQDHHSGEADHDHEIDGLKIEDEYKAVSLSYIYTNSEFMRTRVTVEHAMGVDIENSNEENITRAFVQFVFSIGAHPAHVY